MAQLPNFYQAYQEGVQNSQENAQRANALQIQRMALENARAQQVKEQQFDQMAGFEDPFTPPAPPPGQASVPMQQPQQMPPPVQAQGSPQPPQPPMPPQPPQPPQPPSGFAPGMGMPPPQMAGGAINAQMQPGGPPQPQQRQPIPPYQSVQRQAAPPQPQQQAQQQAAPMPPPVGVPPQQSGAMPPPMQAQQTPEQAAQMASAQIMKLASGPDAYTTMKQNVVQHLVANGVPPAQAEQQAARYLANSPVAQTKLKALEAQRKEALDITTKAQDAADKAFRSVLQQESQGNTKNNEEAIRAETKVRDSETSRHNRAEEGISYERERRESARAAEGQQGQSSYDNLSPARKKEVDYYAKIALDSGNSQWKTGLSRDKDGRELIKQVNARVPELAEEGGQSPEDSVVRGATVKADSAALTKNTTSIAAIRPYKKMLDTNVDVAIELGKNVMKTNSKAANQSINWVKENMGDNPDAKEYLAQIRFVQTEAARVLNNPNLVGQLSDSARHEMQDVVDGNTPINATERVLNRMKKDGSNRLNALLDESQMLKDDIREGPSSGKNTVLHFDAQGNQVK